MAVTALLAGAAAPALASGGSGGGGGGGTSTGGGSPIPVATPTPKPNDGGPSGGPSSTPCATFQSATAPVGYWFTFAAVWNDYTVRSCSQRTESIEVEIDDVDCSSGRVDYDVTLTHLLRATQAATESADNDFAPFDTSYCVTYTAIDPGTRAQLDQATLQAVTPPPH
jgi:hypothetical protein